MREYETVFILDPVLDETQVKQEVDKVTGLITSLGGEVTIAEPPIRKRLAYEIKGRTDGYYCLVVFKAEPATIREMERSYKLDEKVLRHIVVVNPTKREPKEPVVSQQEEAKPSEQVG
jgi:small subunit ribosomal protein S6